MIEEPNKIKNSGQKKSYDQNEDYDHNKNHDQKNSSENPDSENSRKDEESNEKKRTSHNQVIRSIGYLTQIGITIVATVMLGVLLGRALDNWLGTTPWLLLLFSLLGAAAAIRTLFEMSKGKK